MSRSTIPIRVGEYKSCGLALIVEEGAEANCIAVQAPGCATQRWYFNEEGVFQALGASSWTSKQATGSKPTVLLACPHITEEFEGTVVRSVQAGKELGWVCCTDCIQGMLAGEHTHIIDQAIEEKLTERCTVLEATLQPD